MSSDDYNFKLVSRTSDYSLMPRDYILSGSNQIPCQATKMLVGKEVIVDSENFEQTAAIYVGVTGTTFGNVRNDPSEEASGSF